MFLLDINFILDTVTGRSVNSDCYNKLLMELIESGMACISVSSKPTIEYIIKKITEPFTFIATGEMIALLGQNRFLSILVSGRSLF